MSGASTAGGHSHRPEFMAVLGLLPPYTAEDVREAYRTRVLAAHPDRGGNAADFVRLSEAYDRALEYVTFRGDRRAWIATQVECHLAQEETAAEVRRLGGEVELERVDWVKHSWGDGFALLAERLRCVRARGLADGDGLLAYLAGRRLPYLTGLDLAGSKVTDAGLRHLADNDVLQWLDLSTTQVSYAGLRGLLKGLPSLWWLNTKGSGVGWLRRRLLRRAYPQVRVVSEPPGAPGTTPHSPEFIGLADQ